VKAPACCYCGLLLPKRVLTHLTIYEINNKMRKILHKTKMHINEQN
jgi:hypothetical protein